MEEATVVIFGTGYFGVFHAINHIQIACEKHAGIPAIKTVVYTTRSSSPREVLEQRLNAVKGTHDVRIIHEQVCNPEDARRVLHRYNPAVTSIVTPDESHHDYSVAALEHGSVVCEKPYTPAFGDGSSLIKIGELEAKCYQIKDKRRSFSVNLPMSYIARQLWKNPEIKERFDNSKKINFYWVTRPGKADILDNLAIHPWSMIPRNCKTKVDHVSVFDSGNTAEIALQLENPQTRRNIICTMALQYGGNFTGLDIDGYLIGIKRQGPLNNILHLSMSPDAAIAIGNNNLTGKDLIDPVTNPLREILLAALRGHRVTRLDHLRRSQFFLEDLHRYK